MRKTGEHKCLFVRIAACDCDHPGGCNIITFPLYTCYCCYSSIQMPRTQAQRCTAPPCYQLWINILNEGKTTPEGDKKHLCCHSPTPAPSSGQRPAAGIQQMGPVPAARAALATYFILKGILFLFSPNKHNFWCKKSLFVSALYHFQHLWDTCTTLPGSDTCDVLRDRCRCYREIPPPSKYICSRQPEPECVRCKSLSEPELVPSAAPNYSDIGAYNELETPGQGRGISPYHTWLSLSIWQD